MAARSRASSPESGWMSIGALARATGIAVETLRTWERRYGVPSPERKPSGHRLYPASAVDHLRRVGMLLARGHRPAELLTLPAAELDALLAVSETRPPVAAARHTARAATADTAPHPDAVAELLAASTEMDRERVLSLLRTQWTRLGPLPFLEGVAGPFMEAVGTGWRTGALRIRQEHFASACLADFLREVRIPWDERANGPVVALATLEDDLHEGGLLMASVLMAVRGWRVLYVGAHTPVAELAELARSRTLDAVALSVSAAVPRARATRSVRALREKLPRRVALWVGGAGAPESVRGADRFASLAALDARLASA